MVKKKRGAHPRAQRRRRSSLRCTRTNHLFLAVWKKAFLQPEQGVNSPLRTTTWGYRWLEPGGNPSRPELTSYGSGRRLVPPECLGKLQRQAFIDLVASCPAAQFRRSDVGLLCRWAELEVMAQQAAFELQQGGMVTDKGKPSPWVAIHRDAAREQRLLSLRLQIGPRGRTPKAPKTEAAPLSYYETMRLQGDFDDAESDASH
jgi:hypothetical protein